MANPFLSVVNQLLPEPHASLLNGMLFGTKATMTKEFYHSLQSTGVLHIIALSGTNISILIDVAAKCTFFLGKRLSILATLLFISGFVWFVGASPSVVRAAIMGGMGLGAIYFGKAEWSIFSLFVASGIMLGIHPGWLGDISFQLSFLATLGIILANTWMSKKPTFTLKNESVFAFKENLVMTLVAQLFTLPVILYNFHQISFIAPITNILVGWVVQPIMVLGMVIVLLGIIWQPLAILPAWVTWVPLSYFISVVQVLAKVPGASVSF